MHPTKNDTYVITVLFSGSKSSTKTSVAQSPSYWFESIWNTALYN